MGDFLIPNKPKEIKFILIYNILLRDKIIRYNFNISNIGNGYGDGRDIILNKITHNHVGDIIQDISISTIYNFQKYKVASAFIHFHILSS